MSGKFHASAALPPGKDPKHLFDRKLGGLQGRSGRGDKEQFPSLAGNRTPLAQAVAQSLYYPGSIYHRKVNNFCQLFVFSAVSVLIPTTVRHFIETGYCTCGIHYNRHPKWLFHNSVYHMTRCLKSISNIFLKLKTHNRFKQ
jgi:hypothetical protein